MATNLWINMPGVKPVFVILIIILTPTVTASAVEFESNKGATSSTKGNVTVLASGVFEAGGVPVECSAAGMHVTWDIQGSGKVEEPGPSKQNPTKRGPHQQLTVKWQTSSGDGKCHLELGGLKLSETYSPCNLQLATRGGSFEELSGAVETECVIKAPGCEIRIPKAAIGKNQNLKSIRVHNLSKDFELSETNIQGITVSLTGEACPETGTNSKASLTGFRAIAQGETLV